MCQKGVTTQTKCKYKPNNCCLENQYLISKGFLWNQNPNKTQLPSLKKQLKLTKSKILMRSKEKSIKDLTSSLQPKINKKSKIKFLD